MTVAASTMSCSSQNKLSRFCVMALFLSLTGTTPVATATGVSQERLQSLIAELKGNDLRLMRWNALEHTAEKQASGSCSDLAAAASVLSDTTSTALHKQLAAEYATFCITDNPAHRALFSNQEDGGGGGGVHQAVIDLVASDNAAASAKAAHLIYIASYANAKNHEMFQKQGAVSALAKIIVNENSMPNQIMWAAAALQNMAASYCGTENDGGCYWAWNNKATHVQVEEESLPIVADGTATRLAMLAEENLVEALVDYVCAGPNVEEASDTNILPGENAQDGRDDASPNLIAWAAAGALKNLALEPTAKERIEDAMPCLCRLRESSDWLEEAKANDALFFMRRVDPCWFREDGSGDLCIDDNFLDDEEFSCDDYAQATEDECANKDILTGVLASDACCECGGGHRYGIEHEGDEL